MRLNLISIGKLNDVDLVNHFGSGIWKLTKGSLIIARGKKEGSLYFMQGKSCKGEVNVAYDNSNIDYARKTRTHERKGITNPC